MRVCPACGMAGGSPQPYREPPRFPPRLSTRPTHTCRPAKQIKLSPSSRRFLVRHWRGEAQNLLCRVRFSLEQWSQAAAECQQAVNLDGAELGLSHVAGPRFGSAGQPRRLLSALGIAKHSLVRNANGGETQSAKWSGYVGPRRLLCPGSRHCGRWHGQGAGRSQRNWTKLMRLERQQLRGDIAMAAKGLHHGRECVPPGSRPSAASPPTIGLCSPISIVAASDGPIWMRPFRIASAAAAKRQELRRRPVRRRRRAHCGQTAIRRLPRQMLENYLSSSSLYRGSTRIHRSHSTFAPQTATRRCCRRQAGTGHRRRRWRTSLIRRRIEPQGTLDPQS